MMLEQRIAVTGSRHYENRAHVWATLDVLVPVGATLLVGDAYGVDAHAWRWAEARGRIAVRYTAQWDALGRAAGPIRNRTMLQDATALIAFEYGCGKGTQDCIAQAERMGLPVTRVKG